MLSQLVVGNTELGVEVKFKHCDYPVYIHPGEVPEMTQVEARKQRRHATISELFQISLTEGGVKVGAAVTLTALEEQCDALMVTEPAWRIRQVDHHVDKLYLLSGCSRRSRRCCAGLLANRFATWQL